MTLDAYFSQGCKTPQQLAAEIGVSAVTMWRWRTGKARPSWPMLDRLSFATAGLISAADFVAPTTAKEVA